MKYKVGDRVVLKTWEKMNEEFGPSYDEILLPSNRLYTNGMRKFVENSRDRIVTIEEISPKNTRSTAGYAIKEFSCYWDDSMIEGSANEVDISVDCIRTRFEILDL